MNRIIVAYAAPLLLSLHVACPNPVQPKPDADAASGVVVPCVTYCAHLRELHCVGGLPTPQGASCEVVCGNNASVDYLPNTRSCSMGAQTCAAIEACEH